MRKMTKDKNLGIRWKLTTKLEDLHFAYNIKLLSPTQQMMSEKILKLQDQAASTGLRVSTKKSKVRRTNGKSMEPVITVSGQNLDETDKFTYLGRWFSMVYVTSTSEFIMNHSEIVNKMQSNCSNCFYNHSVKE